MTITLDYSDLQFDDDRAVLLADENDFHYELLFARIVFRVDAADFTLEGDEAPPLLDFSFALRTLAASLADGESDSYKSPTAWARITFTRSGEQVAISASFTEATATVGLTELQDATATFHARVIQDLLIRYPALGENPGARKFLVPDPAQPLE